MTITITQFWFERLVDLINILVIFTAALTAVPFMVLWERKFMAYIQQRVGPDRVGPWGLLQTMMDGAKLLLKEDIVPVRAEKFLHALAPMLSIVPAIVLLAILPFSPAFNFQPSILSFSLGGLKVVFPAYPQGFDFAFLISNPSIGLLYYLAITGIAVYGIVLAGWSSDSKYSLMGGIRSSAQMISYELAVGLSILGVLLISGTLSLTKMIDQQSGGFWTWNVISQPIGFLLFMTAGFAECNRLPFDLPEGESELGGGFHTEYSSMKFSMFFMAEYMNMIVFGMMLMTLFFGGYHAPVPALMIFAPGTIGYALMGVVWISIKLFLMTTFMIFIRSTWPRFRYDQLMDLGWKLMLPLALVNLVLTAAVLTFFGSSSSAGAAPGHPLSPAAAGVLFALGIIQLIVVDHGLNVRKKRLLAS